MLRTVWRAFFVCLSAGALAVGAIALGVLEPRPLDADEGKLVRLLVKCDQDELTNVLAALAKTKAEVWDLGTMQRISATPLTPTKPATKKAAPKKPGPIAPLRDASKVMEEIFAAIATVKPVGKTAAPNVTEMVVQPHRVSMRLTVASGADVDRVRKALAASMWLRARVAQIAPGAMQRTTGGFQQHLTLRFDANKPEPGQAVYLTQLDAKAFQQTTLKHRLMYVYAGPVQQDPNRSAGHMTTSREYTFQAAQLTQLRAFLADIPKAQPGLVAFEVRWKLTGGGVVHKPVVRIGGRAPVP